MSLVMMDIKTKMMDIKIERRLYFENAKYTKNMLPNSLVKSRQIHYYEVAKYSEMQNG